jgi:hypothetical protein
MTGAQLAAWLIVAGIILVTRLVFEPYRIADYDTYVLVIDNVYHGTSRLGYSVEPVFIALFVAVRMLAGNTYLAADILQYGLTAFFLLSFYLLIRAYRAEWPAIFVALGLYAPMLAYVTIRATPAYALMALAALMAFQGRFFALPALVLASLIHPTSAIGAIPVLVLLVQRRYGWLSWVNTYAPRIIAAMMILAAVSVALQGVIMDTMLDALASIGQLDKYLVYIESTEVTSQSSTVSEVSVYDRLYSVLVTLITFAAFLQKDPRLVVMRGFVLSSFIIFFVLSFSPVAAFRQSIFWIMPVILAFPWRAAGVRGPVALALMAASVALFIFQLSSVLA